MTDEQLQEKVYTQLRTVLDPDLHKNIVDLEFIKNMSVKGGAVSFDVQLTTPACPVKERLKDECESKVGSVEGVTSVAVTMTSNTVSRDVARQELAPGVRNFVAVASGKGGVGKSSICVNLALALRDAGARVGILDCDFYGPSVPMMLGLGAMQPRPGAEGKKMAPFEAYGLKAMSMGFLVGRDAPVIWRGPMISNALRQFFSDVEWGELDYLMLDLPPGTGDVQLTLSQAVPVSGSVVVTTPQDISLIDARKGMKMFAKVQVPTLGIIENMSYFICPCCNERTEIFTHGGGRKTAEDLGVPFLGEIPIDAAVGESSDAGRPIVEAKPDSPVARACRDIASKLAAQLSIITMTAPDIAPGQNIQWVNMEGLKPKT